MVFFVADADKDSLTSIENSLKEVFPDADVILYDTPRGILNAVLAIKPDYYITEASLGNADGITIAAQVRTLLPQINVAIVNDTNDYAVQAYRIHADSYLLKPITPDVIKRYLNTDTENQL